ncbi:hypothetical protein C8F04DRAFT_1085636 [Mycena alexandri]|uniref:TNase-like domain-containing protein n=1 Tax=Mycena alexandri TaxID=1745969 RepID=A0AAD6T5F0_9AGAR|nr:hypothetical protein C8F04DRAFT_1085636 [Mycena alexandri]
MPAIPWPAGWSKVEPPEEIQGLVIRARSKLDAIPGPVLALSAFALGSATTLSGIFLYRRYFRRIKTGDWITPDVGWSPALADSDNFRFYHTPAFGWRWPLKFRIIPSTAKDLKDKTLHIRIAGVDAPEAAHFGRPSQPYSEEALAWLRAEILGKTVYCQLLRRDQYSRIVSIVTLTPRLLPGSWAAGKSLSLEMLKAGWVTTYEQAGAEYGKWGKEEFLRVENEAKAARRGMWAEGTNAESPSEYKRRHAQAESSDTKVVDKRAKTASASSADKTAKTDPPPKGWLRRLFSSK